MIKKSTFRCCRLHVVITSKKHKTKHNFLKHKQNDKCRIEKNCHVSFFQEKVPLISTQNHNLQNNRNQKTLQVEEIRNLRGIEQHFLWHNQRTHQTIIQKLTL